jgi:hypothetical protein
MDPCVIRPGNFKTQQGPGPSDPKIGEFNLFFHSALRADATLFCRLGEVYILVSLAVVLAARGLRLVRCYDMFGNSSAVDV